MAKPSYPALFHYIQKALADVTYPVTKQEILDKAGESPVFTDWEISVPLSAFVKQIEKEQFSCASDFYCALIAAMSG